MQQEINNIFFKKLHWSQKEKTQQLELLKVHYFISIAANG